MAKIIHKMKTVVLNIQTPVSFLIGSTGRLTRDTAAASELEPDDRHRPGQVTGGDV